MKARTLVLGAAVVMTPALLPLFPFVSNLVWSEPRGRVGTGDIEALENAYDRWAEDYTAREGNRRLVLALGYSKALSSEFTKGRGLASLDLVDGTVSLEVSGLPADTAYDVWLVDNREGPGQSVKPEPGDKLMALGTTRPSDDGQRLDTKLDPARIDGFEIDLVAVSKAGQGPDEAGVLFGSPSLFHRLYYANHGGWYASPSSAAGRSSFAPLGFLVPRPAHATGGDPDLDAPEREGAPPFRE